MNMAHNKRVCRLEALLRPANPTEFSRQLLKRLVSGDLRVTEMRERDGLLPVKGWACPDHLTLVEILHGGRTRNALPQQTEVDAHP
jgi:hypothetical protein